MSKEKLYTQAQFAIKFKVARSTVWRWMTDKRFSDRWDNYSAEVVEVAGKRFIKIVK